MVKRCEICKLFIKLCNNYSPENIHLYGMEVAEKINTAKRKENPVDIEQEGSRSQIIVEIIEYIPDTVVTKTIIKKSKGNISIISFDSREGLPEMTSPFDTYAQIIEGKADIVIDKVSNLLHSGQGIIIPAHSPNHLNSNGRFKMVLSVIKPGDE